MILIAVVMIVLVGTAMAWGQGDSAAPQVTEEPQTISLWSTARPSQLAGGISEALVTTCMGLIVAIPTMFFVSLFRNRIDSYVAEAETVVEKLMGRFRKTTA